MEFLLKTKIIFMYLIYPDYEMDDFDFFEFFVQMILVKVNVRVQILRISLEKYSFW